MKNLITSAILSFALLAVCAGSSALAAPPDKDANEAYWWWGDPVGTSRIVRTDNGISGNIRVHLANDVGSAKGLAVTLWLVFFNNPGACAVANVCGDDADFGNPDVKPDVVYGGGNVVGASENTSIGFHYKKGENTGSISDIFFLPLNDEGEGFGLLNPRGAEVHYVLRFHGPVDPAAMPEQVKTYGGGCVDFAPYGYPSPMGPDELYLDPGQCQDVIFAINSPP